MSRKRLFISVAAGLVLAFAGAAHRAPASIVATSPTARIIATPSDMAGILLPADTGATVTGPAQPVAERSNPSHPLRTSP